MSEPHVAAVVPTLGESPHLAACLASLRAQRPRPEIVVVCPRRERLAASLDADRILETGAPLGFAAATNAGYRATAAEWLATVNDDVELVEDWLLELLGAAEGRREVASLQGVNLRLDDERLADGCGLAWNRWLQAVQIGHGKPAPPAEAPPREIFGVSATAALYRRASLAGVELEGGAPFAVRFESYYEDVDLAARLRSAGRRALLVPAARARHAGSATGARRPGRRARLTYGNRLLTLRRALGRALWRELPVIAVRDTLDALRAMGRGELAASAGMAAGWARALLRAGGLEAPPSRFSAEELRRWSP